MGKTENEQNVNRTNVLDIFDPCRILITVSQTLHTGAATPHKTTVKNPSTMFATSHPINANEIRPVFNRVEDQRRYAVEAKQDRTEGELATSNVS